MTLLVCNQNASLVCLFLHTSDHQEDIKALLATSYLYFLRSTLSACDLIAPLQSSQLGALLISGFDGIIADSHAVEELQVW